MSNSAAGRVFCVGLANQDTILSVDVIPVEPVKTHARGRSEVGGGPAATAAVTIARLGGRAALAARIGDDRTGNAIRVELEAEGVDTARLRSFPGRQSPGSVILVDGGGERLIVAYADLDMPAEARWLDPIPPADAVLCDLSWPQGARVALEAARKRGVASVLDADVSRHPVALLEPAVAATDHVIFSRPGLAGFTGIDDLAEGLRRARRAAHRMTGVTDGAGGVYWLDGDRLEHARAPEVEVVDTVGAGDAFHGAFALALSRGRGLCDCIDFANAVAALKCASPGGRAGLPDRPALAAFAPELDLDWMLP